MNSDDESRDPIPYDRFQEVVKQKNDLAAALKEWETKAAAWETERAEFAKQLGERDTMIQDLERKASGAELAALRVRVAVELYTRLQSSSLVRGEYDLLLDAASLAAARAVELPFHVLSASTEGDCTVIHFRERAERDYWAARLLDAQT